MRLHSVELENWRKHDHKRIDFDDKATIIHGPNESGKSTVLEALFRGFFDRYSTSAQEVRKITPLTTRGGVPSTVKITFSVGGVTYLVEKTFNYKACTKLYRVEDEDRILIAQDDPADRQIIDMLEAELETKGASDPSNWGAFYWLWTLQDKRELPKERDPASVLNLKQTKGQVLVTPKFDSVMNAFENIYSTYFTKTGRDIKNSPRLEIKNELDKLDIERTGLKLRISQVEEYRQELENKLVDLPRLEKALEESRNKLKEAYEESQDARAVESQLEACKSKINELRSKASEAQKALQQLHDAAKRINDLNYHESALRDKLTRTEVQCQIVETKIDELEKKIGEKTQELAELEDLLADARILYTKKRNQEALESTKDKLERILGIEDKIRDLRSQEKTLLVSEGDLRRLESDSLTLEIKQSQLSESGLFVERSPGPDGVLSIDVDGKSLDYQNNAANAIEKVKVYHKGLGEVCVRANLEKAQDLQQDIKMLRNRIQKALDTDQMSSVEELRRVFDENQKTLNALERLSAERKGIDDRSKEEIELELKSLEKNAKRYDEIERSELAKAKNSVDTDLSELVNQREKELNNVSDFLLELREDRDELKEEHNEKREERARIKAEQESASKQLIEALKTQQELLKDFGSEHNQSQKLGEIDQKISEEERKKSELEEKYKEYEEGPLAAIKRLDRTIENQEKMLQSHRASIEQLKGQIKESSVDGAYSPLSWVESRIEMLSERMEKEQLKADSIMLLKLVIEEQYKTALENVTKPIRNDVEKYLAYVTGNLHEEVELDDNLFPVRIGERGMDQLALDYEDGSSGLREVLGLCVRLAVAKHLCSDEPQCLVLDDPFVHVSKNRSEKMIELVNSVIDDDGLQAVILTHRPFEFAGFSGSLVDIQK